MLRRIASLLLAIAFLTSCDQNASQTIKQKDTGAKTNNVEVAAQPMPQPTSTIAPVDQTPTSTPAESGSQNKPVPAAAVAPGAGSSAASASSEVSVGPDQFPENTSPLTGLPVKDSANLALSPALVSVTNFPISARPQAGLSFSPYVYEMYIGEGMTRFLAVFYGNYPEKGSDSKMTLADDRVGPVRSGRLPYESLRKLYNGFLVMASADPKVLTGLSSYNDVFGSDDSDINSALVSATRLQEIASKNSKRLGSDALTGQRFETAAPADGKTGKMIWIPYSFLNQVIWRYDEAGGGYHRFQDNADGTTFTQVTDRLNGQSLDYSNVVILFAQHIAKRETLIDIDLMYITRMPALLFRDGKMYQIYWTTANADYEKRTGLVRPIRFIDAQGNPFPLKPGQTWVEIVQDHTPYNETVNSEVYFDLRNKTQPGSGVWAIHFFPTVPEK